MALVIPVSIAHSTTLLLWTSPILMLRPLMTSSPLRVQVCPRLRMMAELITRWCAMTEIVLVTREGKMIAKPFVVNDVVSAIAEQEKNTNSLGEVQEENKDTELPENIADD